MKTCKMGCGKMKSGGTIKKVKKMALGGSATNKLNNPKAPTKPMKGGGNTKMGIYGIPNAGPTGPNIQGINTAKKGGAVGKLVKAQKGISTGGDRPTKESNRDKITKEKAYKEPGINSPAYNKLFTSTAARDSANYYRKKSAEMSNMSINDKDFNKVIINNANLERQYQKGKPGYDKMGYKKDSEGRSSTSKWYGFDPKTKKYTMGPNKGKTHAQVMKSRTTKK